MKIKQLISLLLCAIIALLPLTACSEPLPGTTTPPAQNTPDDNPTPEKKPTTALEYLTVSCEKMLTQSYLETESKVKSMVMGNIESAQPAEVSSLICRGEFFHMEADGFISTYVDGVFYVSAPDLQLKNKYTVAETDLDNPMLNPTGENGAWFQSVKFNKLSFKVNADGTVTVTGKGVSAEAQAILEETFGQIPGFTFDYDSLEWNCTLDSEYRFVNQTAFLSYSTVGGVSMTLTSTLTYEYGDQYTVTAPADANAYNEVESFEALYSLA